MADLDSSVTFEALYWSDKLTIMAFAHQTHLKEVLIPEEVEYRTYLNLFKDEDELFRLFSEIVDEGITLVRMSPANFSIIGLDSKLLVRKSEGRKFFEKKYGVPDGTEVQKLAEARSW